MERVTRGWSGQEGAAQEGAGARACLPLLGGNGERAEADALLELLEADRTLLALARRCLKDLRDPLRAQIGRDVKRIGKRQEAREWQRALGAAVGGEGLEQVVSKQVPAD